VGSGFENLKMGIKFKSSNPDPMVLHMVLQREHPTRRSDRDRAIRPSVRSSAGAVEQTKPN
jgi:hypothetical protein